MDTRMDNRMELTNESKVKDLVELFNDGTIQYKDVENMFDCSRDLIKGRFKKIGLRWDNSAKKMVGEPTEDDLNIELSTLFEKQRRNRSHKVKTNVGTNEQTHKKNEPSNEPTKERSMVIRKRSSFDIDVELMKELKIQSILHDKSVYMIVEDAIRKELAALKGSSNFS